MAIEYTVYCDKCGSIILANGKSVRAARAEAQLDCGAYCGRGLDLCRECRAEGVAAQQTAVGHSIGARPKRG